MLKAIDEQIKRGNELINKVSSLGRDSKQIEERVRKLKLIINQQTSDKDSPHESIPTWYTEEDRTMKRVMQGICGECSHMLFESNNGRGFWCAALKMKLKKELNNCPDFYASGDEIERLIKTLGLRTGTNE